MPDGMGAYLKLSADRMVAMGTYIPSGKVLFEKLKLNISSTDPFYVREEEFAQQ